VAAVDVDRLYHRIFFVSIPGDHVKRVGVSARPVKQAVDKASKECDSTSSDWVDLDVFTKCLAIFYRIIIIIIIITTTNRCCACMINII
jgi:hypothetical protein